MSTSVEKIAYIAVAAIIAFLVAKLAVSNAQIKELRSPDVVTKLDTVFVYDTHFIERPRYVERRIVDTMKFPVVRETMADTVVKKDTIYLDLFREQKHYSGSDYDAWVSGHLPALDSIRIYKNVAQIVNSTTTTTYKSNRHWGVGVHAGYGMTLSSTPTFTPYIGVGISYNILTF